MLTRQDAPACALHLRNLSLSAPDGHALLSLASVSIYPGVTALTGPNGAGKSTLLRAIAMLRPVDSGSISLGGLDARRDRAAFLSQLVFMPQNFPVYPSMSAQEFLVHALLLRGASMRSAHSMTEEWLQAVGLRSVATAPCGSLSQGMRQRLGLAYALQLDVPLYLLDEPFAGVDPEWRKAMLDLVFRFCADRIVLVITHHVDELISLGANAIRLCHLQLEMTCPVMP